MTSIGFIVYTNKRVIFMKFGIFWYCFILFVNGCGSVKFFVDLQSVMDFYRILKNEYAIIFRKRGSSTESMDGVIQVLCMLKDNAKILKSIHYFPVIIFGKLFDMNTNGSLYNI